MNLHPIPPMMTDVSRYITKGEGGIGFAEFADLVLGARA